MFLTILIVIIAIYWIGISLLGYSVIKKYFVRARQFQSKQVDEKFHPFVRKNITPQNEKTIIRYCFLRFPINIFFMTCYLVNLALLGLLHYHLKLPKVIVEIYREYFGKIALFVCIDIKQLFDCNKRITTPIIISNHVSVFEIVYFGAYSQIISFLSKAELQKNPIIHPLIQHCNGIYVNRESASDREQVRNKIKERVQKFQRNQIKAPLVIFPQGTVSNGKSLLQFKNGAFEPLAPITIFTFNFQDPSFDPNMADLKMSEFYFIFLMLRPKLTIRQEVIKPKEEETAAEYRERCKKRMSEMGNFKSTEASFNDNKEYLNYMMDSPNGFKMLQ